MDCHWKTFEWLDRAWTRLNVHVWRYPHVIQSPPIYSPMSMMREGGGSKERGGSLVPDLLMLPMSFVSHGHGQNWDKIHVHIVTHIQYTLHICTVQDSHSHSWHGISLWVLSTANESISHFQQECCPNINESIACNIVHCQPVLPLLAIHLPKHCFWMRWH